VSSSQAIPGFFITAPPSVCVADVNGVLAVWNQKPKKKKGSNRLALHCMHLEAELLTHEEIPTQCGMATQEWNGNARVDANTIRPSI